MTNNEDDFPPALVPAYEMQHPNQNITLYSGAIELTQLDAQYVGTGALYFRWLPYPGIEFCWSGNNDSPTSIFEELQVGFPQLGVSVSAHPISVPLFPGPGKVTGDLAEPIVLGDGQELKNVIFHLVNFHEYRNGEGIRPPSNRTHSWRAGRLELEGEEWRVTIDSIADCRERIESARSVGGFVITHVGKLERIDDSIFTATDANRVMEALFFFLSFVRGFWVAPILPIGFNRAGERVWSTWGSHVEHPYQHVDSWFPLKHPTSIRALFSEFLKRFYNPIWNEPIRLAIQWYIDSNLRSIGLFNTLPGGIVIEQVALEMLSWVQFVEEGGASRRQFDAVQASEKIRRLLSRFNVPTDIPAISKSLVAASTDNGWSTSPDAFTAIRNWTVHSTPQKRDRIRNLTNQAILEAWKLGLWYIELILLSLLKYEGVYHNRLRPNRNQLDAEAIPWGTPPAEAE